MYILQGPSDDDRSGQSSPNDEFGRFGGGGGGNNNGSNRLSTTVVADDATRMFELRPLTGVDSSAAQDKVETTAIVCDTDIV